MGRYKVSHHCWKDRRYSCSGGGGRDEGWCCERSTGEWMLSPRPGEFSHVIQLAATIYTGGLFGVDRTRNQKFERTRRLTCNFGVSKSLFEDFFHQNSNRMIHHRHHHHPQKKKKKKKLERNNFILIYNALPNFKLTTFKHFDMSPVHQVWAKPSCKAQWKEEEDKVDREEVGR